MQEAINILVLKSTPELVYCGLKVTDRRLSMAQSHSDMLICLRIQLTLWRADWRLCCPVISPEALREWHYNRLMVPLIFMFSVCSSCKHWVQYLVLATIIPLHSFWPVGLVNSYITQEYTQSSLKLFLVKVPVCKEPLVFIHSYQQ